MASKKGLSSKEKEANLALKTATTRANKIKALKKHLAIHPEDPSAVKALEKLLA